MGEIAAKTVIDQIEGVAEYLPEIIVEPELVLRASTGRMPTQVGTGIDNGGSDGNAVKARRWEISG